MKDELTTHELPDLFEELVSLAIRVDTCIYQRWGNDTLTPLLLTLNRCKYIEPI